MKGLPQDAAFAGLVFGKAWPSPDQRSFETVLERGRGRDVGRPAGR